MKKLLLLITACISLTLNAQFTVTTGQTSSQLAQSLAGAGVTITGDTLICPPGHYGQFFDAPAGLGITDGVLLGTGIATEVAQQPGSFASTSAMAAGDPDLDIIFAQAGLPYTSNDACILEFDINVTGDSLNFEYVFGSEEYDEWVCNGFNDIFAFFLTGPNPAGGMYNNQNVALIPGSATPVAINTVNNGFPAGSDPGCQAGNTAYFNGAVTDVVWDGNTVALTAFAQTVPCADYRFKLAIADGGDWSFDSGVFLKEGSFSSNAASVASSTVLGQGFNTAVEGCVDGQFTFTLQAAQGDSSVNLVIGGTAINGVDYTFIEDTVAFANGDTTVTIIIEPLTDALDEGFETVIIYVEGLCPGIYNDSAELVIADGIPVTINPTVDSLCTGDSVNVVATGAQTYSWDPPAGVSDPNGSDVWLSPSVSSFYVLTYGLGNCIEDTVISMAVSALNVVDAEIFDETCPMSEDGSVVLTLLDSINNISYLWDNGDTTATLSNVGAGTYTVQISDGACDISGTYTIESPAPFMELMVDDTMICQGDVIQFTTNNNLSNSATYIWEPANLMADSTLETTSSTPSMTTWYYLTGVNPAGCSVSDSVEITVDFIDISALYTDTIIQPGSSVSLGVQVDDISDINGIPTFSWSPVDFLLDVDQETTTSTPTAGVLYTVTGSYNGCEDTATIEVLINVEFNMPTAFTPNGDNINDTFYPENVLGGGVREFRIFNQWGEILHNDHTTPWDGTYNGQQQPQGVYYYYIRVSNGSQEDIQAMSFTLLH